MALSASPGTGLPLIAFLLCSTALHAQTTREVWQYAGTDSAAKTLAGTERFDAQGNIVYRKVTGWQQTAAITYVDGEFTFEYADTLVMVWNSTTTTGDSSRVEFQYDGAGRLVHQDYWERRYVDPDTVQSGMFTVVRVPLDSTEGKWVRRTEVSHTYDQWGREVRRDNKSLVTSWNSSLHFAYDDKGRMLKCTFYMDRYRDWEECFEYFDGGYRYTRTWFSRKGKKIRKPGKDILPFMLPRTYTFRTDAQGRIIEEQCTNHKGKLIDRTVTFYNAKGKVTRTVYYDAEGKPAITHVYEYR
jgi:hypothetical protein